MAPVLLVIGLLVAADVHCEEGIAAMAAELLLNGSKKASEGDAACGDELITVAGAGAGVSNAPKSSKSTTGAGAGAIVEGVWTGAALIAGALDGIEGRTVIDTTFFASSAAPVISVPLSPPSELVGSL